MKDDYFNVKTIVFFVQQTGQLCKVSFCFACEKTKLVQHEILENFVRKKLECRPWSTSTALNFQKDSD